jgi:hypothetical protein
MSKPRSRNQRRSSAEWSRLVQAWTASGLDAQAFGRRRGIEGERLKWWRWKLSRAETLPGGDCTGTIRHAPREELRLVPVEVMPEAEVTAVSPSGSAGLPGWELTTSDGSVLRVHGSIAVDELRTILASTAKARGGRR